MHQFLILGGDPRQLYLSRYLKQAGFRISLYYENSSAFSLKEAVEHASVILCPIPFTKDGKNIHSVNGLPGLEIDSFLRLLTKDHILFGGVIPAAVTEHCTAQGVPCHDFMKMEETTWKNTVATAEGAVAEAISLSPLNLHQSRCLITGWGRCAQTLASKLKGLDAAVTIAGRDKAKLSGAGCQGYETVLLKDLDSLIHKFDYIFNTIPAPVLSAPLAELISPNAAVIDIASAPGGVDFDTCRRREVRAKLCPGLPGVYSPMSSAQILFEAVMEQL